MQILEWNGEIGYDLFNQKVNDDLKMANGEDITARFSSIGGSIFEGADMISTIADYRRDFPSAKMILEIKGVAASMGSAFASSPVWNEVLVDSTTAYMIHRPTTFSYGDFENMKSSAEFLERASETFVNYYSAKSGKTSEEIKTLMKDTTWYYGQAIVDNGFANKVIDSELTGDSNMIIAGMKNKFATMCNNQKQKHENDDFDIVRASACFKTETPTIKVDEIKPTSVGQSKMEVPMNEEELKAKHPELYESVMKSGAKQEKDSNSERVKALTEMKKDEDYKDVPEIQEVLDSAIMGTETVDSVIPKINLAVMKIMKDPARMSAIESPGAITGGNGEEAETPSKIGEV